MEEANFQNSGRNINSSINVREEAALFGGTFPQMSASGNCRTLEATSVFLLQVNKSAKKLFGYFE